LFFSSFLSSLKIWSSHSFNPVIIINLNLFHLIEFSSMTKFGNNPDIVIFLLNRKVLLQKGLLTRFLSGSRGVSELGRSFRLLFFPCSVFSLLQFIFYFFLVPFFCFKNVFTGIFKVFHSLIEFFVVKVSWKVIGSGRRLVGFFARSWAASKLGTSWFRISLDALTLIFVFFFCVPFFLIFDFLYEWRCNLLVEDFLQVRFFLGHNLFIFILLPGLPFVLLITLLFLVGVDFILDNFSTIATVFFNFFRISRWIQAKRHRRDLVNCCTLRLLTFYVPAIVLWLLVVCFTEHCHLGRSGYQKLAVLSCRLFRDQQVIFIFEFKSSHIAFDIICPFKEGTQGQVLFGVIACRNLLGLRILGLLSLLVRPLILLDHA